MDDYPEPESTPTEASARSHFFNRLTAREVITDFAATFTWVLLVPAILAAIMRGNIEMAFIAGAGLTAWVHYLLQGRDS